MGWIEKPVMYFHFASLVVALFGESSTVGCVDKNS